MSKEDVTSKQFCDASSKNAKHVDSNQLSTGCTSEVIPTSVDVEMDQDDSDGFKLVSRGKKRSLSSPSENSSFSKRVSPSTSNEETNIVIPSSAAPPLPCKFCREYHPGKQCYLRQLGYLRPISRQNRRQKPGYSCKWCNYGPHNGNECPTIGIARLRLADRRQIGSLPPQEVFLEHPSKSPLSKRDGTTNPLTLSPSSKRQNVLATTMKRAKNQALATINRISSPDMNAVRLFIVQDKETLDYPNIEQEIWDALIVDINREWCRLTVDRASTFKLRDYHRNNREATIVSEDTNSTSFLKTFLSKRELKAFTQAELLCHRKKTYLFTGALQASQEIRRLWDSPFLNEHVLPVLRNDLQLEEDNILRLQKVEDRGDTRLFFIEICEDTKKKWFFQPPEGQFHLRLGLNIVKFCDYAEQKSLVRQQVEAARRHFEERYASQDLDSEKSQITPSYKSALISSSSLKNPCFHSGSDQEVMDTAGVKDLPNLSIGECQNIAIEAKSVLKTVEESSRHTSTFVETWDSLPKTAGITSILPISGNQPSTPPFDASVHGHEPNAMESLSGPDTPSARQALSHKDSPSS